MDIKELADGLAAKFNIDGLAVEDGEVALEIDGMPILLAEDQDVAIVMTGHVGEPPAEGGEAFANLMLEATMGFMDSKSLALARNAESGSYALVGRVAQEGLTVDAFSESLTEFVNTLETWRKMLEDFRPMAAAAKAASDAQPDAQELALNGFMQV